MKWKDIKVGQKMKDGSVVTQIHRKHQEECCKVTYDNDRSMICAYKHVFLIDVHNLPDEAKEELNRICTYVPLEENYEVYYNEELSIEEKLIVQQFLSNEPVNIDVKCVLDGEIEVYDFCFASGIKKVYVKNVITKKEPQKVDDNTYWLTCKGIDYLMKKYNVNLYCNGLIINSIEPVGKKECFCISTDTGRYET